MCGILLASSEEFFGSKKIVEAIKRMEYRGYDSWGIVNIDSKVRSWRGLGTIKENIVKGKTKLVLAHTRWATHGGVKMKNCHPFSDCQKRRWLVHNGIVENYLELEEKSHKYLSETDSERMVHYLEKYDDLERGLVVLSKKILGKNSLVVVDKKTKTIGAYKNGSPLILGIGKGLVEIVSDMEAFDEKVNQIYCLSNKELLIIKNKEILLKKDKKTIVPKWQKTVIIKRELTKEEMMIKEINESQKVLKRIDQEKKYLEVLRDEIKKSKEVILVGCGSARVAAEMGALLISKKLKKRASAYGASEIENYIDSFNKKSLVITLSQSGESMDLIEAIEKLQNKGMRVVALINREFSTISRMVDKNIPLLAGREIAVVATKSFLAMIYWFMKVTDYKNKLKLDNGNEEKEMANKLAKHRNLVITGKGENLILAKEMAIKLKEACYLPIEAIEGAELKHGPLALIDKEMTVICLGNDLANEIKEIEARKGKVIKIDKGNLLTNLYFIQKLSFYLAKNLGINPDKPRNLAKSVTVK